MVTRTKPDTTVPVEIVRDGQNKAVQVTVATLDLDENGRSGAPVETSFGILLQDLTPQLRTHLKMPAGREGALVASVERSSAAARAGIRAGDVLLEVNRMAVNGAADAGNALQRASQGDTTFALLWREGRELFVTIT